MANRDSTGADVPRGEAGKWLPGTSPNPGGKPKKLREIEEMLDAEHRTVENMREGFAVLRRLAFEGTQRGVYYRGALVGHETEYSSAFMELYFNRMLGPVKETKIDLSDAPDDVLAYLRGKIQSTHS